MKDAQDSFVRRPCDRVAEENLEVFDQLESFDHDLREEPGPPGSWGVGNVIEGNRLGHVQLSIMRTEFSRPKIDDSVLDDQEVIVLIEFFLIVFQVLPRTWESTLIHAPI